MGKRGEGKAEKAVEPKKVGERSRRERGRLLQQSAWKGRKVGTGDDEDLGRSVIKKKASIYLDDLQYC